MYAVVWRCVALIPVRASAGKVWPCVPHIVEVMGVAAQEEAPAPGCGLYRVHDALSQVTETRRRCLPYDGTLDFPVIFVITAINIIAISLGTAKLAAEGEIISLRGTEEQNVKMIALVLGLVEAMPGVMFLWCAPLSPRAAVCRCRRLPLSAVVAVRSEARGRRGVYIGRFTLLA